MENFHIYRDGQYDRRANLKMKVDAKADELKRQAIDLLYKIDACFARK